MPESSEGQSCWPSTTGLSITPPGTSRVSGLDRSSTSDIYSDALLPLEPSMSSTTGELVSDFDRFCNPSMHEIFELGNLDVIDFAQEYYDMEKLLIPDSMDLSSSLDTNLLERLPASKPSSPSSYGHSLSSSASYTNVAGVDTTFNATCNCLMLALEFLRKFSPAKPSASTLSSRPDNLAALTTTQNGTPPAQVVVVENKQTIEAVSDILQCSCAEDASLLIMLSMIVFKILGRYSSVAGTKLGQFAVDGDMLNKKPPTPSSYFADDERGRIAAAQMILSELHHVQRLVNQLSPRLRTRRVSIGEYSDGRPDGKEMDGDRRMSLESIEPMTATFSSSTLDQIELDLRRCLSTLSSEIINLLRQS